MPITGISTQIAIARSTDFARETSVLQKRQEITLDYLAIREKISGAQEKSKVAKTLAVEMETIRTDVDRDVGSGYSNQREGMGKGRDRKREHYPGLPAAPGDSIIDVFA